MLSILIPTYNYDIYTLVTELHKQCLDSKIKFEILCLDDASIDYKIENQRINELSNCKYLINNVNLGRTSTRNKLAEKANFNWLLFLDADVIPIDSNFIKNYHSFLDSKYQVIVGGYRYQDLKAESEVFFRHKYGKEREEKTALDRNLSPYNCIFSGNILIRKETFITSNFNFNESLYGMDNFLAYQLYLNKIEILHIDNSIYHLGLESDSIFFEKSLKSVEIRKKFLVDCDQIEKINTLIKAYKTLKKYKLLPVAILLFKFSEPFLKNRILNKNPSLFCFDIYRLGYMCTLK